MIHDAARLLKDDATARAWCPARKRCKADGDEVFDNRLHVLGRWLVFLRGFRLIAAARFSTNDSGDALGPGVTSDTSGGELHNETMA
jgi:hypothetical protein